jgi:hypothetical protein
MTKQSEISRGPAASLQLRSRQQGQIESRTQYQPAAQLTPFTRYTHLCIMIEWVPYVLTYGRSGGARGGRLC